MDLWTTIERARDLWGPRPAVTDAGRTLTYAAVADRAERLAGWLSARGVAAGDRVAALLPNGLAYYESYYAAARLGAVLVPLNWRLTPEELEFILRDSGTEWLVGADGFGELPGELETRAGLRGVLRTGTAYDAALAEGRRPPTRAAACPPSTLAHLYYTSGTTGRPKGVMLTHGNVVTHALGAVAELGLSDRDTWAHVAPMFHLADAWATFAVTLVGGRHVMLPRFEAEAALRAFDEERVTITNLVPTMLNLMVKHPARGAFDYSALRLLLSGGAPIAPEVVRAVVDTFGCEYVQTYGMTETSPYLTLSLLKAHLRALPPEEQLAWRAKTGRPFVTVELRVVDAGGRPVPADERTVGEIEVRGPTVTPGYWRRPDATAEAFRDGWLRTGDLAVLDHEGYVTIVDRRKDMIITGGENVYSTEVEAVLYLHPAVLEAAVYGEPDEVWGEVVAAAVVLRPGAVCTEAELLAFCDERLAAFKRPRRVRWPAELPKTGSGKILKRALREAAQVSG